ncbi:alpha/beta hydrolase [Arthrobacter crystallopoietes]|uniref:alpha/beta hydrolase n=1 Tax=Micrococcaceae TaxID=1268 RepID=UPI0021C84481|nr:alpha/beta hydrolase [Arthrobacter sp. Marseille-P9274]
MRLSPRRSRRALTTGAAVVVLLMLTGCGLLPQPQEPPGSGNAADPGTVDPALKSYYTQDVAWEDCEQQFQCAKVEVPVDYAEPDGERIEIAAIRSSAGNGSKGSILLNPGGPGGSGYDTVKDSLAYMTTEELRRNYDIVGFDPRGVKRSAPVKCMSDKEKDEARQVQYDLDTDAGLAEAARDSKELAQQCAEQTGEVLGHVDTVSAAKDMDILRAAVGDAKLNYLGFSYGTFLGATYADLFPERVGRLVLDGALDPSLSNADVTLGQAKAFEAAIRSYAESCLQSSDCPMDGSADDAVGQIRDLIAAVEDNPMTASDGRLVTVGMFVSGLIVPLYNDQNWPALTAALKGAFGGDPTEMLRLSDLGAERQPDGSYTGNSTEAFTAINCLDYPMESGLDAMREEAKALEDASPTLGRYLAYGGTTCENWSYDAVRTPAPVKAEGADPILVVGTTGDPATPYEWAESMAANFESASLLTFEAEGHTAYSRGNKCVQDAVDGYFIEGTMPKDGAVC